MMSLPEKSGMNAQRHAITSFHAEAQFTSSLSKRIYPRQEEQETARNPSFAQVKSTPPIIETSTVTERTHINLTSKLVGGMSPFKEFAAVSYGKEAEVTGKSGFEPANSLISTTIKDPHYLPSWNPEQKYPPLKSSEYVERGLYADPHFLAIIRDGVIVTDLTPTTSTEVAGLQLSSLNSASKDQLARLVAERKVVVFRDQDFADPLISKALEFGPHHILPNL